MTQATKSIMKQDGFAFRKSKQSATVLNVKKAVVYHKALHWFQIKPKIFLPETPGPTYNSVIAGSVSDVLTKARIRLPGCFVLLSYFLISFFSDTQSTSPTSISRKNVIRQFKNNHSQTFNTKVFFQKLSNKNTTQYTRVGYL